MLRKSILFFVLFFSTIDLSFQGYGIIRWPQSGRNFDFTPPTIKLDDKEYKKKAFGDLIIKPPIELGKLCVYNSECSSCPSGYSQWCIANRCQCKPSFPENSNIIQPKGFLDCVTFHRANAALVYFDYGLNKCIVERYKSSSISQCNNHHTLNSPIDSETYCLNALNSIDMVCYDNKMCQNALNTNETVGLCMNGICHATSTSNFVGYINDNPSCDKNVTSHCQELNYVFHKVTHSRNALCSIHCKEVSSVSGVAAAHSNSCMCFKTFIQEPTRVDIIM